jgi:hypothetical protein
MKYLKNIIAYITSFFYTPPTVQSMLGSCLKQVEQLEALHFQKLAEAEEYEIEAETLKSLARVADMEALDASIEAGFADDMADTLASLITKNTIPEDA